MSSVLILAQSTGSDLLRLLLLRDYNTRVVLLGTMVLGVASGLLGVYLLLRRRVLIGDAISHATLPGVALAFLWTATQGQEKSLTLLLIGAALSGALGGASVIALRHVARVREDAALGIVLSVFFGAGVALVTLVQKLPGGNAAGLDAFIYGKAASMTSEDVWLGLLVCGLVVAAIGLFGKEFKILCFDAELAKSQGWPVLLLDSLLIGLVVAVTIAGLQAVGLILVIALQVIPAASARFWTHNLKHMLGISAAVGAASCAAGTVLSATVERLPSGATIVLMACALFVVSFVFGTKRGVLWRVTHHQEMRRQHDLQHFLRAFYEILEASGKLPRSIHELNSTGRIPLHDVSNRRGWSDARARNVAFRLAAAELVVLDGDGFLQLTPLGMLRAAETVRDHRLLEIYLVDRAEAGTVEADRAADYLEHDLHPEHLAHLWSMAAPGEIERVPPSPHQLKQGETPDDDEE